MTESNYDYHADTEYVGSSMLSDFAGRDESSPALYKARWIDRTIPRAPPSPEMVLGSLTHTALIEPERFDDDYVMAGRTSKGTALLKRQGGAWEIAVAQAEKEHKTPVLEGQWDAAQVMAQAVRECPAAMLLIDACTTREKAMRCVCPVSGLKLKARPDWLGVGPKTIFAPDLKTSATIPQFRLSVFTFGYDVQNELYRRVIEQQPDIPCLPIDKPWIVVDKTPAHNVAVIWPSPKTVMQAGVILDHRLDAIATCMESGDWLYPIDDEPLDPPGWRKELV